MSHAYHRMFIWSACCRSPEALELQHQMQGLQGMEGEIDAMNEMYKQKLKQIQERKGIDSRTKVNLMDRLRYVMWQSPAFHHFVCCLSHQALRARHLSFVGDGFMLSLLGY